MLRSEVAGSGAKAEGAGRPRHTIGNHRRKIIWGIPYTRDESAGCAACIRQNVLEMTLFDHFGGYLQRGQPIHRVWWGYTGGIFLPPTLHPVLQSPQRVQAGCGTPCGLGEASLKLTLTSASTALACGKPFSRKCAAASCIRGEAARQGLPVNVTATCNTALGFRNNSRLCAACAHGHYRSATGRSCRACGSPDAHKAAVFLGT